MDNIGAIVAFIVAVLTFVAGRATSKANANAVDIDTFHKLVERVENQSLSLIKIREDLLVVKSSNRALWEYVYELIDFIKSKGHVPPNPPEDLDTNPKLVKLLRGKQ